MKVLKRFRMLSVLLSISMVCGLNTVPLAAKEETVKTRNVTFTVSAGDLLIATNPVPWVYDGYKGDWNDQSEPIGTVEFASEEPEEAGLDSYEPAVSVHSADPGCRTMELSERVKRYLKAHPEVLQAQLNDADEPKAYEVGDWIWHGYGHDEEEDSADTMMKGAPVYYAEGEGEVGEHKHVYQGDEKVQGLYYRKYICLYKSDKITIWAYVADSETKNIPENEPLRDHTVVGTIPTYLSPARAEKIGKDLEEMKFIEKMNESAGDYLATDKLGDKDKKIAFLFEPIESSTLGFSYFPDQWKEAGDSFDPGYSLDCLHIQLQCTIGTNTAEGDADPVFEYGDDKGVPPYSTMAHELTHYIVNGYANADPNNIVDDDGWINEWFAQSVMVQVIPRKIMLSDNNIKNDFTGVASEMYGAGFLKEYAGPVNELGDNPYTYCTYPISTLMAGFFSGRMGDDFYKDAITKKKVTALSLSNMILGRKGALKKGLKWWMSAFNISLLSSIRGVDTRPGKDNEFALDPYTHEEVEDPDTPSAAHKYIRDTVSDNIRYYEEYLKTEDPKDGIKTLVNPLNEINKIDLIPGGGVSYVFEVTDGNVPAGEILELEIEKVGEDVVWAHKDGAGNIETDGMPEEKAEDEGDKKKEEGEEEGEGNKGDDTVSDDKGKRKEDGSWEYSKEQKDLLTKADRPVIREDIANTEYVLDLNLKAAKALKYTGNKKTLTDSILDKEGSTVSINGNIINIKKVVLKNPKKAYVSENSAFKEMISENNLSAYAGFSEKKKPGYYLVLDTRGLEKNLKKAVKKANKQMKKNPIPVEILPVNLTTGNFAVIKYNGKKNLVTKAKVTDDLGNTIKAKNSAKSKKDFVSTGEGDKVIIMGTNNLNGSVSYDPASGDIKAV